MKNLFDKEAQDEILERLEKLTPESQRQWGKMEVGQMLAHCKEVIKVPLNNKKYPRIFIGRLIGWAMKPTMYNDAEWRKNLPTGLDFIIKDSKEFEVEKKEFTELVNKFYHAGPENITQYPHPFFGNFTSAQWGKSLYKHINHHLVQFGV